MSSNELTEEQVIEETRLWVERIIVKHNFCPFAHKPVRENTIRYVAAMTDSLAQLADRLADELVALRDADTKLFETTIVVAPNCLHEFEEYNQFLDVVDMLIEQLGLEGIIQVASFHPDYQFADLSADDVRNYTNRSIYPTFHLILEDSIEQARATHPDVDSIPDTNMELLEQLGLEEIVRQRESCKRKV